MGGRLLWTVTGANDRAFGQSVAVLGNLSADGLADAAAGQPDDAPLPGQVLVLDGATGAILRKLTASTSADRAGVVDGDGTGNITVGAPGDSSLAPDAGRGPSLRLLLRDRRPHPLAGRRSRRRRPRLGRGPDRGPRPGRLGGSLGRCSERGPGSRGRAYLLDGAGAAPPVVFDKGPSGVSYGQFFLGASGDVDPDGLGDVDGDGEPDFLMSSVVGSDFGGTGLVHVISGSPAPPRASCAARPPSGGLAARLTYRRSISLAAAEMELRVDDANPSASAIPVYGFAPASLPLAGSTLCVADPLRRLPVERLNTAGAKTIGLDLTGAPLGAGGSAFAPGTAVYFQVWFRGASGRGGANLTPSFDVTSCP